MVAVMTMVTHEQVVFEAADFASLASIAQPIVFIEGVYVNAEVVVRFTALNTVDHLKGNALSIQQYSQIVPTEF